jgi:beta-glucosidase
LRDPRWGRNEEGYAEDPLLTGVMATAYAGGLRGGHPRLLKTAPTLKHFLGYNNETRRETTSSNLGPRVLHEYELPAFHAPIAAGAAVAVMASYNLVNGRPAHLSPLINTDVRSWTDDDILVVSDAAAPTNVATRQAYYPDHVASHAALVRAGVDSFTDNGDQSALTVARLTEAIELGLLTEADIDTAARRVLAIRVRLGEFDPVEDNPYAAITEEVINCPAHQDLAREAARQSLVLLKNADEALPLRAHPNRVAVIGPLADALYEDWYSGTLPYAVTARRGLAERLGEDRVEFVEGVDRVALRFGDAYVVASAEPGGAGLRAGAGTMDADAAFDIVDWGHGVRALRAVANGRHVTVDEGGLLVNDQMRPNGWVVRETFGFDAGDSGETFIRHIASGRYVAVADDGSLRANAASPDEATGFALELIRSGRGEAIQAARDADVAIVVVGNHPLINGRETEDRVDLALPPCQEELLRVVHAANPRTVLVVQSSYPFAIEWAQAHLPAIVWSSHGGQEFGHALADMLFGDTAPAGRLTQTWYGAAADLPDLLDYDIIEADATYLYFRGTPLYPFGHGLTYTTFSYEDLRLSRSDVDARDDVEVSVTVRNTGTRASDEVVQLYTRQLRSRVKQPLRQLRGFERVHLGAGEQVEVHFTVKAADLAFWDVTRDRAVVESSQHAVMVGRSCTDIRQATTLTVRGEGVPPRDALARPIPADSFDHYAGVDLRDASPTGGDAVTSAESCAWIAFDSVDFGAGADTCVARIATSEPGVAEVTLRLDDPWQGHIIGAAYAHCHDGRYAWLDVSTSVRGAVGVHDLYAVFPAAGVCLDSLTFGQQ